MKNNVGRSPRSLVPQINSAIPGVNKYGAALTLGADLETTMNDAAAALELSDSNYEQGRIALRDSRKARNLAMKNGAHHMKTVRELMKPILTPKYSQQWDAFGFTGSLQSARTPAEMISMLAKLANHLAANPALGAEEPNLLAAKASALKTALLNANTEVNTKHSDLQRLFEARTADVDVVRVILRRLLSDLSFKLTPLDSRWTEFGFNKPGAQPIPPMPEGVTAVLIGSNAISIKWPPTTRAEHYRIWARVIGVDTELGQVGTSSDLDFLLEQLPGNTDVEVALSAVNTGGESAKTTPITVRTL